jgi:predicted adenylyl cyclase CyaB
MEIEIRAFIKNIKEFEKRLVSLGAKFESESHIIDKWFSKKDAKSYDDIKMDKAGSYGLRLRTEVKNGKEHSHINCKVLEKEFDHNAFHEFESDVADVKAAEEILEHTEFKKFCTIDKTRRTYKLKNCLVNVEDIKGFKPAVEFEIIDNKDIDIHKKFIEDTMKNLGIGDEDKIEKSITLLYMKEKSKF